MKTAKKSSNSKLNNHSFVLNELFKTKKISLSIVNLIIVLFIATIALSFFLSYVNSQVNYLNKKINDLSLENMNLKSDLKLSQNGGKKVKVFKDEKYKFSMDYPENWTFTSEIISAENCGLEKLNEENKNSGVFEGECEEIIFTDQSGEVLNLVVSDNQNSKTDFSFKQEIYKEITDLKIASQIKIEGFEVNRYNLSNSEGSLIGYSYNITNNSLTEKEKFTGDIHIKNLYFGVFTTTSTSLDLVEMALESLMVD